MVKPCPAQPTVKFIADYCENYIDTYFQKLEHLNRKSVGNSHECLLDGKLTVRTAK